MRPVVFDWEKHDHVLESQEVVRQSGYREPIVKLCCRICTEAAMQHLLVPSMDYECLGFHPEGCRCFYCEKYPEVAARQRDVVKAKKKLIPF